MRVVLAALSAVALVLTGATHADAGKPPPPAYGITVQWGKDVPAAWPRNAPDAWEAGTRLGFTRGTCGPTMCVRVHTETGTLCRPEAAACSSSVDPRTGVCDIWLHGHVLGYRYGRGFLAELVVHEVGHCLGLPHSTDPLSIMWSGASPYDAVTGPSPADVTAANTLWPAA